MPKNALYGIAYAKIFAIPGVANAKNTLYGVANTKNALYGVANAKRACA